MNEIADNWASRVVHHVCTDVKSPYSPKLLSMQDGICEHTQNGVSRNFFSYHLALMISVSQNLQILILGEHDSVIYRYNRSGSAVPQSIEMKPVQ